MSIRAGAPTPIEGTWERYSFKVGNLNFLMMSDRNDSALSGRTAGIRRRLACGSGHERDVGLVEEEGRGSTATRSSSAVTITCCAKRP